MTSELSHQVPGVPWFQKKGNLILQNRWRRIWGGEGGGKALQLRGKCLVKACAAEARKDGTLYPDCCGNGGGLQTRTEGGLYEYKTWN